ncbi:MAG: hypothetical protein HQK56_21210 [Deltaproteobacteria bacterium]|nr:hypothetical protein [Deltaproteobacteria bacterium]
MFRVFWICIGFLYLFFSPRLSSESAELSVATGDAKRIFIVSSYDEFHVCGNPQLQGILNNIQDGYSKRLSITGAYMETLTRNNTPELHLKVSEAIIRDIKEFKPDLIITIDDDAFEHVGIPLSKDYPIFFSGINRFYSSYLEAFSDIIYKPNIKGVEERISLSALVKIMERYKFSPKEFILLSDNTETSYYMTQNYISELKSKTNYHFSVIQITTLVELREFIKASQSRDKSVLVLTLQRVLDERGKMVPKKDILREIYKYNSKHLELGANPLYAEFGIPICMAPDFSSMGSLLGVMVIKFLNKEPIERPILEPINSVSVNLKRLKELGFNNSDLSNFNLLDKIYKSY